MYMQKLTGASISVMTVVWVVWCTYRGKHGESECACRHGSLRARSAVDLVGIGVSHAGAAWADATSWVLACVCMAAWGVLVGAVAC